MFGSHLSIAGGLVNALHEAKRLRLDCVQVFTKNQRQWKVPPLDEVARAEWLAELGRLGWRREDKPGATVAHNSYLINLASPDATAWKRSVDLQREEMSRAESLDIPYLVSHPGAHLGEAPKRGERLCLREAPRKDELRGLKRIAKALDQLHREEPGLGVITCLETTTGSGTNLGYSFGHLAMLRQMIREPERVGFCFDTCHVVAAGYDMSTEEQAESVLQEWALLCGLGDLRVMHLNDSVGAAGSRVDRHAHIGKGACGLGCFQAIVNHPDLGSVPKILETPKEEDASGVPWDRRNIRRLKRLIRRPVSCR